MEPDRTNVNSDQLTEDLVQTPHLDSTELTSPAIPHSSRRYLLPWDFNRPSVRDRHLTRSTFDLDFTGYMDLVLASYFILKDEHPKFTERIPYCLYQYYCVYLLWRRLAILKKLM